MIRLLTETEVVSKRMEAPRDGCSVAGNNAIFVDLRLKLYLQKKNEICVDDDCESIAVGEAIP